MTQSISTNKGGGGALPASQVVTVVVEGPPTKRDLKDRIPTRFLDQTKKVLDQVRKTNAADLVGVVSPTQRYGKSVTWHKISEVGLKDLYVDLSIDLFDGSPDVATHLNRFQFGHANEKACLETGNKKTCNTDVTLEAYEKEHLNYDSRFTYSSGCYTGKNIDQIDLARSAAIYEGTFGDVNRGEDFFASLNFYLSGKYSQNHYDFNQDGIRTVDEAFAYAVDRTAADSTSIPTLLYPEPISLRGREALGPWQQRDEQGNVKLHPTSHVKSYEDLAEQAQMLKAGQMILVMVKQPGQLSSKKDQETFEALTAKGMYKPVIAEFSPEEWKRYQNQAGTEKPSSFYFVDRFHQLTAISKPNDPQKVLVAYMEAASYREKEKIDLYEKVWASENIDLQLQVLNWLVDDSPAVFRSLSTRLHEALNSSNAKLKKQAEETIALTLEDRTGLARADYLLSISHSRITKKYVRQTFEKLSPAQLTSFLQFSSLVLDNDDSNEEFYVAALPYLKAQAKKDSDENLKSEASKLLFKIATYYPQRWLEFYQQKGPANR